MVDRADSEARDYLAQHGYQHASRSRASAIGIDGLLEQALSPLASAALRTARPRARACTRVTAAEAYSPVFAAARAPPSDTVGAAGGRGACAGGGLFEARRTPAAARERRPGSLLPLRDEDDHVHVVHFAYISFAFYSVVSCILPCLKTS